MIRQRSESAETCIRRIARMVEGTCHLARRRRRDGAMFHADVKRLRTLCDEMSRQVRELERVHE